MCAVPPVPTGSISGGAFNPAVGMLAALANSDSNKGFVEDNKNWKWVGCYWLGPMLGALLAAGVRCCHDAQSCLLASNLRFSKDAFGY